MDSTAALQRNAFIMDTIVYEEVNGGGTPSLDSLLKTVKEAYSINADKDLQMYGESLTEQDIACSIATQFPTMTMYNGIDLTRFRPDCSAVTETDFAEMQKEADRLAQLDENVANSLSVCDDFGYCPCVEDIAAKYGATADEVKESIIRVDPTKTDYCGTGCECVDLRMSSCVSIYC
ncbi:hypothetical protein FSP39_015050 [Pinctada imbricata]|uniref:Uncharacterized protein n=1 Tax=Pinctada imbricata TaxID=66713 RepID=A0AA88YPS6_PINIB|nr:hypothetical protein FSP39_015050 [Pinctada imbricata]